MTVKLVDNKQDKPNSLVDDKRVWFVLMGHQESLVDNKRVGLPWWNNFFVSLMSGTTEPDEKDIWIGWCRRCFTNEASNEICIAILVRKILSLNVTKLMEQKPISWALSGGNGSWHGKPTRRIMAFGLQGRLKWRRCPLTKKICLLLTFTFGTKKNFCRFRKNWLDWFKQQKSTINFRGWLLILGYYDQEAVNCNAIANDCK